MVMNIAQFIISIPLFLILFFGLGFMLNMIFKTTWFPTIVAVVGIAIFWIVKQGLSMPDIVILLSGIAGAFLSSWSIGTLRKKGYRMF